MFGKNELNDTELKLLTYIRRNPNYSKSQLSASLNIPWATVSNAIKNLTIKNMIMVDEQSDDLLSMHARQYASPVLVNPQYEYYVGISVGSSNIKFVILDYSFQIINRKELEKYGKEKAITFYDTVEKQLDFNVRVDNEKCCWCSITPDSTDETRNRVRMLSELLNGLKDKNSDSFFNLAAICFAFPGYIDYENQKIISTSNIGGLGFSSSDISQFLSYSTYDMINNNDISVNIDHNVKCCTIAEQEAVFVESGNKALKNLVVLYLGKGLGMGLVLDSKLYRGTTNNAGQYGLTSVKYFDNNEMKQTSLEEYIRTIVFRCKNTESDFRRFNSEDLQDFLRLESNKSSRLKLIDVLSESLSNLVLSLGVDNIVFSGKLDKVFLEIETELIAELQNRGLYGLSLRHSKYGEYSAAVGAAMSCFNTEYAMPFEWID